MPKTIQQTVTLNASPEALFDTYLDSKRHAAVIGSKVSISRDVGRSFTAFDGGLTGRNLMIVPKQLIVQAWRGEQWKATDADSILILIFNKATGGARINLIHANVPDHQYTIIHGGWRQHYWNPWKAYLKRARSR